MSAVAPATLFFRALAVPPAERADWITRACAHDPVHGADLLALLQAHGAAGRFLAEAPLDVLSPGPGTRVARFTLRRRLGEGGCGTVFAAYPGGPDSPLVALKLLRPGCDTPEAIARFDTEGRALARLAHPGIPRLIAAGRTEAGDAYLAMELVRGRRLTAHCDAHRLPIAERLELFAHFCDVLDHVHDRGVRHGDLKPANILVARASGSRHGGTPVLVDFGLASLAEESGSPAATPAGAANAGTLRYLSPEHVATAASCPDHRSDLYAAGVVLHQLLTGRTPFGGVAVDELRHWFATTHIVVPSRLVAALNGTERCRLARRRQTTAAGLTRALRGAVDCLVQRALARDPDRRFQSATEFATAIRRLLRTAPGPRPASPGPACLAPLELHSATPATFPAHNGPLRRENPAAAA